MFFKLNMGSLFKNGTKASKHWALRCKFKRRLHAIVYLNETQQVLNFYDTCIGPIRRSTIDRGIGHEWTSIWHV